MPRLTLHVKQIRKKTKKLGKFYIKYIKNIHTQEKTLWDIFLKYLVYLVLPGLILKAVKRR
jgi:hypothetical protein